jgi:hypothetical protein
VNGVITLTNSGTRPVTLGNIVVNLQTMQPQAFGAWWATRSSVIANATQGDAATSAKVLSLASSELRSSFTENAASGALSLKNGASDYALSPQKSLAPGASLSLQYTAGFDNSVLALPAGTPIRAEIFVSLGNALRSGLGSSYTTIDVNGNGTIEPDERLALSLPARVTLAVPASTTDAPPVLSDTAVDITTTGTVTFSNAVFNLGPTSGTVSVNYHPGTSGARSRTAPG